MSITSRTIAIVLAMALVAVISLAGSRAVFSVVTSNPTNSFATGDIDLTDDDGGSTIMFSVVGMFPGDTVEHCIGVTYSGPDGQATNGVKIYVPSFTDSATLADDLVVTIEEGAKPGVGFLPAGTRTGAGDGLSCAGFANSATIVTALDLSDPGFPTSYATGSGTWTPGASNPETLTYKITVTLDSASTAEGQSVTLIPFTWEVQAGS